MKKETKIGLSALILGGGSILAGASIIAAAGMAVVGVALSTLTIHMAKKDEQIAPEISNNLEELTEQEAQKTEVTTLNLDQCDLFIKRLKVLLNAKADSDCTSLQNVLNNAIQQYVNCMLNAGKQDPFYLSQYKLQKLEHMLHIVLVHIGLERISYQIPRKIICDLSKFKNIDDIDKLLLAMTYTIHHKQKTHEYFLNNKSYDALLYLKNLELKNLATQKYETDLEADIQRAMTRNWTVTSVYTQNDDIQPPSNTKAKKASK